MPQIGFSMTEESDVTWSPLHEEWTKEEVLKLLCVERGSEICVHTQVIPAAEAQDVTTWLSGPVERRSSATFRS
jgi:hypothetical protein